MRLFYNSDDHDDDDGDPTHQVATPGNRRQKKRRRIQYFWGEQRHGMDFFLYGPFAMSGIPFWTVIKAMLGMLFNRALNSGDGFFSHVNVGDVFLHEPQTVQGSFFTRPPDNAGMALYTSQQLLYCLFSPLISTSEVPEQFGAAMRRGRGCSAWDQTKLHGEANKNNFGMFWEVDTLRHVCCLCLCIRCEVELIVQRNCCNAAFSVNIMSYFLGT